MAVVNAAYVDQNTLTRAEIAFGRSALPPSMQRILIAWGQYGLAADEITVNVDLVYGVSYLDKVSSLYITNLTSSEISIQFPDTQFPVRVPGVSVVVTPVFTNGWKCSVTKPVGGALGTTYIFFTNMVMQPGHIF